MKFSEKWLRSWVNPDLSTSELCHQLTMAGLEVDGVEPAASAFTDVVVARVESLKKHPDADKLNVCQVFDGKDTVQIVCGAANVRAGLLVPLAKICAVLPGANASEPLKIKAAKLRGVASSGMLCSEKELGLADSADGLMELPADALPGTALREYLELDDSIIEIDLTPNRGDCLSIAGVARELAALNQCAVNERACEPANVTIKDAFKVNVSANEACTHYAGRMINNIHVNAPTPLWMVERLRRSGIRSLGAIVDVTNYVMLELGQPMHAFDLATLDGQINVRFANQAEKITLLDGKEIELDNETLVIADNKRALALAGVMGGENSGVSDSTRSVFLESAFFVPEVIAGKARSHGLHTDSSHRFERGVDPALQVPALERATELVLSICGGEAGPITESGKPAHPVERPAINLRRERIKRMLGIEFSDNEVSDILQRLGMQVQISKTGWSVTAPSFRFDIAIEADLLEELVRIYGYNNIPRTQPTYRMQMQAQPEGRQAISVVRQMLVDRGYFEAITYSFVDPKFQQVLDPEAEPVALANPISSEMSVMRTTLWPGLVQALRHNLNRQQTRVRLFESGLCFHKQDSPLPEQKPRIAAVICGEQQHQQWGESPRQVDFFDLKADVEALLAKQADEVSFVADTHPALHPGQSARILVTGEAVGWLGALHPSAQQALDIDQPVYLFELELESALSTGLPRFQPLSRFPEVRRDLALVVGEEVHVGDLVAAIRGSASALLRDVRVFDIYSGKGVEPGRKSVALGLILQEFSRTLTDQEVETEIETVVATLKQNFAATLRE
jgi:phenylalanyl-tRNA synthetase beta chain